MKDKVKGLLAGLLIGTAISGTVAYAAGGSMIEVFYTVKDIKINSVSKVSSEKPFTYNGTTFVPLRFVSEALGEDVKWDSKTQTIWVGKTEDAAAVYPGDKITPMNYQAGYSFDTWYDIQFHSDHPLKDNVGNEYSNFIKIGQDWNISEKTILEFPLNGQFKKFVSKVGLTDEYKSTTDTIKVTILLDGTEAYTKNIVAGDFPSDINLNIEHANKITLEMIKITDNQETRSEIGFFDAHFTK